MSLSPCNTSLPLDLKDTRACPLIYRAGPSCMDDAPAAKDGKHSKIDGGLRGCVFCLTLDARRSALGKGSYLIQCGHGCVTGESGEQRSVRPSQLDCLFRRLAAQEAIDKSSRKAVSAADAIDHIQLSRRSSEGLAVNPGNRAPAMAVGGVHLAQGSCDHLHMRMLLDHVVDHAEEHARIQLRLGRNFRPGDSQTLLQVFFVADEDVNVLNDGADDLHGPLVTTGDLPKLLAEVQIKRSDGSCGLGFPHHLRGQRSRGWGERREDAATVHPFHASGEDLLPVEVANLELRGGFIASVVEDHWRAHAKSTVAVYRRHIRTGDAVVFEVLVKRLYAHGSNPLGNQVTDGIVGHCRSDSRLQSETVRE